MSVKNMPGYACPAIFTYPCVGGNCGQYLRYPLMLQDDGYCDCPGTCDDESFWDCDTCGCPDNCGGYGSPCFEPFFQCPGSNCTVPIFYVNDNFCYCPNCADEDCFFAAFGFKRFLLFPHLGVEQCWDRCEKHSNSVNTLRWEAEGRNPAETMRQRPWLRPLDPSVYGREFQWWP